MEQEIMQGDALEILRTLPERKFRCCITSPPYFGLRDYGMPEQIGQEDTPEEYIARLVAVFHEVKRVLTDDGTLWLNIGDSYAGSGKNRNGDDALNPTCKNWKQGTNYGSIHGMTFKAYTGNGIKPKDLIGIPWMLAFALRADGWFLRQDIIWHKPNGMPESIRDRCTRSHEYIFLLSKSRHYFFNAEAIAEPVAGSTVHRLAQDIEHQAGSMTPAKTNGPAKAFVPRFPDKKPPVFHKSEKIYQTGAKRNKRDVWTINTKPYKGAHFAVFPDTLVLPCLLAGSAMGDIVLDPFFGSGTVGVVACRQWRGFMGIELNPLYIELAEKRIAAVGEMLPFA